MPHKKLPSKKFKKGVYYKPYWMIDNSDPVVQIIFAINNQLRNKCLQYLELDPIGFSFMQGIGTNPLICMLSVKTRLQNVGLIRSDYIVVVVLVG